MLKVFLEHTFINESGSYTGSYLAKQQTITGVNFFHKFKLSYDTCNFKYHLLVNNLLYLYKLHHHVNQNVHNSIKKFKKSNIYLKFVPVH